YVPGTDGLLAEARWPAHDLGPVDEAAEAEVAAAIEAIRAVRSWRDSTGVRPGARLPARLPGNDAVREIIGRLARLDLAGDGEPVARVGAIEILASDEIDAEADARRAAARGAELKQEVERAEAKLANDQFVARAPATVVQAERDKLAALERELAEL
ncbi:MAG: valine--tRNA ligase, partial [Solirubrobacteraceae bacterium]